MIVAPRMVKYQPVSTMDAVFWSAPDAKKHAFLVSVIKLNTRRTGCFHWDFNAGIAPFALCCWLCSWFGRSVGRFFVVLFSGLGFLSRFCCFSFYRFLVVFFSSLGFLLGLSWFCRFSFYRFLVVLFSSLGFLFGLSRFCCFSGCCFLVVLFSSLSFLLGSGFFVFFVMGGFSWRFSRSGSGSSRRWRRGGVSSESSGRQTHSSGNNQS